MAGCHEWPVSAPAFVVAPYVEGANGRLVPLRPSTCPLAEEGARACRLSAHSWRVRKTGPPHPLRLFMCAGHDRAFTVYPPGHVPYGRLAIVTLAPDGSEAVIERSELVSPQEGAPATLFQAAEEAALGKAWARSCRGGTDRWWGTQWRHLRRAVRLAGVCPGLPEPLRERLAETLAVDGLMLHEFARSLAAGAGYASRGRAVSAIADAVGRSEQSSWRLLEAGCLAGLWRRPTYVLVEGASPRRSPFRIAGARGPPDGLRRR